MDIVLILLIHVLLVVRITVLLVLVHLFVLSVFKDILPTLKVFVYLVYPTVEDVPVKPTQSVCHVVKVSS